VYHSLVRIEEKDLNPNVELTRKVAKRLKEESECLKIRKIFQRSFGGCAKNEAADGD
jgi:DNA-binding XRE family transcriptional regulator